MAGPRVIKPGLRSNPLGIFNHNRNMESPLTRTGQTGSFLRLVLAQAMGYGMPPRIVAGLDDIAAMLGFYEPLSAGQSAYVAGPLIVWQTDRRQATIEHVADIQRLAMKQRCLIAFGGAPADHMVGTAEIVTAMANTHRANMPEVWRQIWAWAATAVLSELHGCSQAQIREAHGWPHVFDDEVLRPTGRYYPTYMELVTWIRRNAISGLKGDPETDPRTRLRPLALFFLHHYQEVLQEAETSTDAEAPQATLAIKDLINTVRAMFPDISLVEIKNFDPDETTKENGFQPNQQPPVVPSTRDVKSGSNDS
jgi:hypothetical protein